MRDEQTLRNYFDFYLQRHSARLTKALPPKSSARVLHEGTDLPSSPTLPYHSRFGLSSLIRKQTNVKNDGGSSVVSPYENVTGAEEETGTCSNGERHSWPSQVNEVILVRKLAPLASLRVRRQDVLRQLEVVGIDTLARGKLIETL